MDTIFKEGDKVFDIMLQKWGVVLKINDTKVDYPIHVQYIDGLTYYSLEGHLHHSFHQNNTRIYYFSNNPYHCILK